MSATWGADSVVLVSPDNSNDLPAVIRGISFATAGALKITTLDGTTTTIPSGALAAGIIHPITIKRVWSTGTTAANIVGYT